MNTLSRTGFPFAGQNSLGVLLSLAVSTTVSTYAQAQSETDATITLPAVAVQAKRQPVLNLDAGSGTGSRLGLSVRETPASVEVITQQTLQERGARTLEEALRGATGMTVGGNPTSPGIGSTRGFTGGFITYLFDGVRVSTPTMSSRPQDSWNYERIEVLKGPASVLYGEGGIGGAVNFVSRQPDRSFRGAEALLSYGSYGALRAGLGSGGPLGESGAYRVDLSHQQSDGWVERSGQKLDHITAAVNFALAPAVKLDLSVDYLRDDVEAYYGTPLVSRDAAADPTDVVSDSTGRVIDKRVARTNYNVADSRMDAESLWLRARLNWQLTPRWRLRNELSAYTAGRRWRNAESLEFVAPDRINRNQVDVAHDHQVWGDRLDLSHLGTLAGMKNRFVTGIDHTETDFATQRRFSDGSASTNDALQVGLIDPVVGHFNDAPALATGAGNRTNLSTDVSTTALFLEDALSVTDALTVVAGLRTEHIRLHRTSRDLNTGAFTAFDKTYRPNSLRLGMVYDWSSATALYAHAVNAAAPVGTSNLLLMSSTNAKFPLTRGRQFEVGVKQSLADQRFDWTLALYKIEQSDVLSPDPANPGTTVNNGQISSRGIELSAAWRATRGWTLSGNLAAVDARFDTLVAGGVSSIGNRPPNVPARTANLWADYRFETLPLTLGAGLARTGAMYTNNANTVRINGYTLLDVHASWRFQPALLSLRVRNLTDKLYASWAGANPDHQVMLGAPRTVELSAKFDF